MKDKRAFVIYEKVVTEEGKEDEKYLFDCDTYQEVINYFKSKEKTKISKSSIFEIIKSNGVYQYKYKLFRINLK